MLGVLYMLLRLWVEPGSAVRWDNTRAFWLYVWLKRRCRKELKSFGGPVVLYFSSWKQWLGYGINRNGPSWSWCILTSCCCYAYERHSVFQSYTMLCDSWRVFFFICLGSENRFHACLGAVMEQYRPSLLTCHKRRVLSIIALWDCMPGYFSLSGTRVPDRQRSDVRRSGLQILRAFILLFHRTDTRLVRYNDIIVSIQSSLYNSLSRDLIFRIIWWRKSRAPYPGRWNTWRESGRSARAPLLLCTHRHIGSRRWSLGYVLHVLHHSWGAGRGLWKEEKKIFEKNVKNIDLSVCPPLGLASRSQAQLDDFSENTLRQELRIWIRSARAGK